MFDVAAERGAAGVSVADVVERSGVSRRTFYDSFTDREDCFLAAFEDALAFASQRVLPAYVAVGRWRERLRAGLVAFLSFLDEEPLIGRLLIVESLSGGSRTLERREQILAQLATIVDEGRSESASARDLPALTAEGLVGGVLALICARIARPATLHVVAGEALEGSAGLLGLTNELVGMIVLPYLGPAAARRELQRPIKAGTPEGKRVEGHTQQADRKRGERRDASLLADPFKGAGMRVTYRTLRVLLVVAEHAGASNRLVGESAGISDQGQISKLLARLQRVGLIENRGLAPGQGAPNAWVLTNTGERLATSIREHTQTHQTGETR